MHLFLILMAYQSAVHDSTACTPVLLMLGRELRTPAELIVEVPPETPAAVPSQDYAKELQDRMDTHLCQGRTG